MGCINREGNFTDDVYDNLKNMGEVSQEEISKAPIKLVKHFEFVLETKSNHLQV